METVWKSTRMKGGSQQRQLPGSGESRCSENRTIEDTAGFPGQPTGLSNGRWGWREVQVDPWAFDMHSWLDGRAAPDLGKLGGGKGRPWVL